MAETADCLREKSVLSLLAVDLVNQLMSHPSIDRGHTGDQSYLPREPQYLLADGDYATDVDILLGFDENESVIGTQIFLPAPDLFTVVRELWSIVGPYALLQKHTSEITEEDIELTKDILNYYCGPLDQLDHTDFDNFTKMVTDSFFWFGAHRFLDLHLNQATGNTFFYRNKYVVSVGFLFLFTCYDGMLRENSTISGCRDWTTLTSPGSDTRTNSISSGTISQARNTHWAREISRCR